MKPPEKFVNDDFFNLADEKWPGTMRQDLFYRLNNRIIQPRKI